VRNGRRKAAARSAPAGHASHDLTAPTKKQAPPPPASQPLQPPPPPPPPPSYTIRVTDPLKHGDGVSAYVSYKVRAAAAGAGPPSEVIRRFRDFAWLHARLGRTVRGAILPPLPEKTTAMAGRLAGAALSPAFVEGRRAGLEAYLSALAAHPLLAPSPDLASFLTAPEEEWALAMARADHEDAVKAGIAVDPAASVSSAAAAPASAADPFGGAGSSGALATAAPVAAAAKRRLGAAWAGLRGLGASAAAFAAGKGVVIGPGGDLYADATEDPSYLRAREAVAGLEGHLSDVSRAVARAIRKQAEAGAALAELGSAAAALARHEGPGAPRELGAALAALGERGGALGRAAAASADRLNAAVSAPLAEAVRSVKCARAAMADRGNAGGALAAARNDVDARRARLTRLRGTPGTREEKVREGWMEREGWIGERGMGWRGMDGWEARGWFFFFLFLFFFHAHTKLTHHNTNHTHPNTPARRGGARPAGRPDRGGDRETGVRRPGPKHGGRPAPVGGRAGGPAGGRAGCVRGGAGPGGGRGGAGVGVAVPGAGRGRRTVKKKRNRKEREVGWMVASQEKKKKENTARREGARLLCVTARA
jgi:hypothetical protein